MKIYLIMLLSFILSGSLSAAPEQQVKKTGKVVNTTNLHKEPKYKSPVVRELVQDEAVNVLQRNRAWYQISTDNDLSGWIKMLNVRFVGVMKREGELGVKNVFDSVVTKQISPTASTGIRGFDEADLKNAKANIEQLIMLASYKTTPEKAYSFAKQGKLKAHAKLTLTDNKS